MDLLVSESSDAVLVSLVLNLSFFYVDPAVLQQRLHLLLGQTGLLLHLSLQCLHLDRQRHYKRVGQPETGSLAGLGSYVSLSTCSNKVWLSFLYCSESPFIPSSDLALRLPSAQIHTGLGGRDRKILHSHVRLFHFL